MQEGEAVFRFQAYVDLTKHLGGLEATEELVRSCHLDEAEFVLDVGCGVGATPCYLAKRYGCRVVGVDKRQVMIERSRERARREGVSGLVELAVAEVENLPFEDGLFDAVIGESVVAFVEDRERAVRECARVSRPGGYVGLNESTWLDTPPKEMVEYVSQANAELLDSNGWSGLLEAAGLGETRARVHRISTRSEFSAHVNRYGLGHLLRVWCRTLILYVRDRDYRELMKVGAELPKDLFEYFGYGIYVGRV